MRIKESWHTGEFFKTRRRKIESQRGKLGFENIIQKSSGLETEATFRLGDVHSESDVLKRSNADGTALNNGHLKSELSRGKLDSDLYL